MHLNLHEERWTDISAFRMFFAKKYNKKKIFKLETVKAQLLHNKTFMY
jgi:hypothetical protein